MTTLGVRVQETSLNFALANIAQLGASESEAETASISPYTHNILHLLEKLATVQRNNLILAENGWFRC